MTKMNPNNYIKMYHGNTVFVLTHLAKAPQLHRKSCSHTAQPVVYSVYRTETGVKMEHDSINDTYCQKVCCKRCCGGPLNVNIQPETVRGFSYRKHKSNNLTGPQHKSGSTNIPSNQIFLFVSVLHTTPCR